MPELKLPNYQVLTNNKQASLYDNDTTIVRKHDSALFGELMIWWFSGLHQLTKPPDKLFRL